MRWLKRLLLGTVLLSVLLVTAVAMLLGTGPGVRWLLQAGDGFIPGELKVEQTWGSLLGELRLQNVSYQNPDMSVQVGELVFNWAPAELLDGVFHLKALSLEKLRYEKRRDTEEEASSDPLELPDIELPLALKLDRVEATELAIVSSPAADPLGIDRLLLVADWGAQGVRLKQLEFRMPEVQLQGAGQVDPRASYPLDLQLDWRFEMDEMPKMTGQGRIRGDVRKLHVEQQIDGDVKAQINASLRDLLSELGWEARVKVSRLPEAYLSLEQTALLGIDVDGKGDLRQADARVVFQVKDGNKDRVEEAPALLFNLLAHVGFADRKFKVNGDWQNVQWPLSGKPQVVARQGKLEASGIPDDYAFSLSGRVEGDDIPAGDWQIAGKGDMQKIRLDKLLGKVLEGSLEATGDLSWSPLLSWKLDLTATDIDPETLNPEWPGRLNAEISSVGEMPQSGLKLQARIKSLGGELRERPVAGSGALHLDGGKLLLEGLALSSGTARLNASGELGDSWDLAWQLDVADLGDLLPQGEGTVRGEGKLKGNSRQPVVEGQLKVRELFAEGYRCAQCDADFSLGLDETFVSRLLITGKNLLAPGQKIPQLTLKLDGPLRHHLLDMSIEHEQGKLALVLAGAYLQDKLAWDGEVQKLDLDAGEIGNWQLKQAASLWASAEKIELSPLCLVDQQASLCAQVERLEDQGSAGLKLQGLSLSRVQPWLPPEITGISGILHLDASADLGPVIKAKLNAVLEPGEISYLDQQSRPVTMKLHDGKVDAVYDEKQLQAKWFLGLDGNEVTGDLLVPRQALDSDPLTAPLQGKVKMLVNNLSMVTAFVPDIQKIDGNIDISLVLGGQLGEPLISGHALIKSDEVLIPRAGLTLEDVLVQVQGDGGKRLTINGGIKSGEGLLELTGNLDLDAQQGWPAKLLLKGQQFQLANLPEARVVITPDISLESSQGLVRIRGQLGVPVARIEIHDLPEGSRDVSSDVVVKNEDGSIDEIGSSRIDAEITVALGEDVHFKGFGLNADLGGRLTIYQKAGKFPTANGELKILNGFFRAYGQNLTIEQGRISYAGGRVDNPGVRLRASRKMDDITVGVELTGTAKKPEFSTYSTDPDLTDKDIVSILLTGQKSGDLSNAKVYAGKQITEDLSVGVNLGGGSDGSEFVTRYRLMKNVTLEGVSSAKKSGGSINYSFELD